MIYNHVTEMIGNTPLLLIPEEVHCIPWLTLYAKLEYQNPFWSLKDRFARASLQWHVTELKNNSGKIVESSSGNTIKAIAWIANTFGISCKTITNRINVQEQKDMLMLLGVDIEQLPSTWECIDLSEQDNAVARIEKICKQHPNYKHTDQYRNHVNTKIHYTTTWPEINRDLPQVDYFFGTLWTSWSSQGTATFLKEKNKNLHTIGIISTNDDFIPWIRNSTEMDEVWLFDRSIYNAILEVNALEALASCLALVKRVGMFCWPTTGAVYQWIIDYFKVNPIQNWKYKTAVFIACDRIEPYMSYIKQRLPHIFHKEHKHCILKVTQEDQEKYTKKLSCPQLKTLIENKDPDLLLIDTRHNQSYKLWHITWSLNLELNLLTELSEKWTLCDKNKTIILICPFGKQTTKLCAYLNMSWFNTYSLEWWLQEWKKEWYHFII
jgi:cysteine synthase B